MGVKCVCNCWVFSKTGRIALLPFSPPYIHDECNVFVDPFKVPTSVQRSWLYLSGWRRFLVRLQFTDLRVKRWVLQYLNAKHTHTQDKHTISYSTHTQDKHTITRSFLGSGITMDSQWQHKLFSLYSLTVSMQKGRSSCNIGLSQFDSKQRCSVLLQTPLNLLNHPFQTEDSTASNWWPKKSLCTVKKFRLPRATPLQCLVITEECDKAVAEQVRRRKRVPEATKQRNRVRVRRRKGLGERQKRKGFGEKW